MRRAKQRGNKGPNDPFNKNGKNQDFIARARGQKGSGPGVEAGPGPGPGTGPGPGPGSGPRPAERRPGPGLRPAATRGAPATTTTSPAIRPARAATRRTRTSRASRATRAARRARRSSPPRRRASPSKSYQKVYADYQRIVEEVMRTEKLPSSYKYYVKRYFAKIHPSMSDGDATSQERAMTQAAAAARRRSRTVSTFTADLRRLREEIGKMIVGQEEIVEGVLMCLLGGGHALLEGVPGLGKTMLVRTLAETIHATFSRIQFTPDLMPADIVGTNVIVEDERREALRVREGPDLREHRARRRDQPRDAEDAVRAARGDERRLGHRREADLQAREAVLRARDAEPARDGRHLSAARGAARSLLLQARRRVSRHARTSTRSSTARRPTTCRSRRP